MNFFSFTSVPHFTNWNLSSDRIHAGWFKLPLLCNRARVIQRWGEFRVCVRNPVVSITDRDQEKDTLDACVLLSSSLLLCCWRSLSLPQVCTCSERWARTARGLRGSTLIASPSKLLRSGQSLAVPCHICNAAVLCLQIRILDPNTGYTCARTAGNALAWWHISQVSHLWTVTHMQHFF